MEVQFLMSDTVDDDAKVLFQGVYAFIEKYGYQSANVSGFVNPTGVSLTLSAAKPENGGNYQYTQFFPHAATPAAPAPAPISDLHR